MKRLMIIAAWLCGMAAVAQTANVGVNTRTPESTLDVRATKAADSETTNEGIIAPRLTKTRVANIATPVEGTLVYVTDVTYAGSNAKVAKVTEKGYYFYNGTEWVKVITPDDPSKWQNDAVNTLVKLKNLSDGVTSRTDEANVFVKDNGYMGLGLSSPLDRLHVKGNMILGERTALSSYPQVGSYLSFEGANSNTDLFYLYRCNYDYNLSDLRLILGDDYTTNQSEVDCFSIGVTNRYLPPTDLSNIAFTNLFRFASDGVAYKVGSATWTTLSDARTKDSISPYKRGLKEIMQINPVNFRYKSDTQLGRNNYVGVLAQDLEKVVPSMVITTSEKVGDHENIKQVDGNEYTFMLINAVKELQQEVEALKTEIKTLKK